MRALGRGARGVRALGRGGRRVRALGRGGRCVRALGRALGSARQAQEKASSLEDFDRAKAFRDEAREAEVWLRQAVRGVGSGTLSSRPKRYAYTPPPESRNSYKRG